MKIKIINKIDKKNNIKEIIIKPGDGREITASQNSDTWNTKSINDFLIRVVSQMPEKEYLEIEPKIEETKKEDSEDFKFIVELLNNFAAEFNKNILTKENTNSE